MTDMNVALKRPRGTWKGSSIGFGKGRAGEAGARLAVGVDRFAQLKAKLLHERLAQESDPEIRTWLERAADESAALAWTTPFPLLVWPELLEEVSQTARHRAERQRIIRERSRPLGPLAA